MLKDKIEISNFSHEALDILTKISPDKNSSVLFTFPPPVSYEDYKTRHGLIHNYLSKMFSCDASFKPAMMWLAGISEKDMYLHEGKWKDNIWEVREFCLFPGEIHKLEINLLAFDHIGNTVRGLSVALQYEIYERYEDKIYHANYKVTDTTLNREKVKLITIPGGQLIRADFRTSESLKSLKVFS